MGWYAWLSPLVYAALGGLLMLGVLHATSSPAANWQCTQCTGPPAAQPPQNMPGAPSCTAPPVSTPVNGRHKGAATCCFRQGGMEGWWGRSAGWPHEGSES